MSSTVLSSSPTAGSTVTRAMESSPPIYHLLHFLREAANVIYSVIVASFHALVSVSSAFLRVFHTLSTPILYLLAPFLVFAQILLEGLVYTPYRIVAYLAYSLYPAYVLVGTACIAAAVVGMTARLVTHIVKHVLVGTPTHAADETSASPQQPLKPPAPAAAPRPILRERSIPAESMSRVKPKRVSIKKELLGS